MCQRNIQHKSAPSSCKRVSHALNKCTAKIDSLTLILFPKQRIVILRKRIEQEFILKRKKRTNRKTIFVVITTSGQNGGMNIGQMEGTIWFGSGLDLLTVRGGFRAIYPISQYMLAPVLLNTQNTSPFSPLQPQ